MLSIDKFQILNFLNSLKISKPNNIRNYNNLQVAIKLVNKSKINVKPRRLERIRREIDFMANINHPHIIKILEGNFIYKTNKKNKHKNRC